MLVGSTIGSGIFRVPSVAAAEVETVGAIALLWVAGALISLAGVLTMAELATMFPRAGGICVYLLEAYGPLPAFLFGWTRLLVIQPAVTGAIAMIFAAYVGAFVPLGDTQTRVVAASAIVALGAANYRSLTWSAAVQNASSLAKVLALLGLAAVVFLFGDATAGALVGAPRLGPASWGGFGIALIAVMWTFDGWSDVTYMAGEVRAPGRTIPLALVGGLLTVAAVYLLVNAAYLYVLTVEEMSGSTLVAADAAGRVFGAAGAAVVSALVLLSTLGALNGPMMSSPRIFYAMANDGLFFQRIAAVHPRYRTPHAAIVLVVLLGVAYVSVRTFEQLAEAFVIGIWPFYVLAVGAVFLLRCDRPRADRPYRTLGYPVTPILFLITSIAMLGNALARQPGSTLFSFGVIVSGIPAYYVWRARERRHA